MTETYDAAIIRLELTADYFFTDVSLEGCKGGLVHIPDNPHIAHVDGGIGTAPPKVDIISQNRLIRFFRGSEGCRGYRADLGISPNHSSLVSFPSEIEPTVLHKPHNTPASAAGIGNTFLRHPGVHNQPIGETMAPFSSVAVEVDGVGTTQFMGCDEFQPVGDEGRDGIKEEGDVFSGDESGMPTIGGFVPVGSGVCNDGYTVDRPWRVIASSGKGGFLPDIEGGRVDLRIVEHEGASFRGEWFSGNEKRQPG